MAIVEDAASVLEQFVQDVANLPAEIAHLLEEIQAKDRVLQECRSVINTRDNSIQKWMKVNGTSQLNPKEEPYSRTILANFDKAQTIQEEKVGLSAKVGILLDRQIKRLDLKIRDLQNEGTIAIDPTLPSLLNPTVGNRLPPISTSTTGASTPLNPLSGNAGPSTTIANNNLLTRLVGPPSQQTQCPASPVTANPLQPHHSHLPSNLTPTTIPASTIHLQNRARESSAGASDAKRRRLTAHLPLPPTSSNLRQSSLGPGTPKAGTPSTVAARGGSAGPRPGGGPKKTAKKVAPHQRVHSLNPSAAHKKPRRVRPGKKLGGIGTATGSMKPSPSDTGDDESVLSEVEGSEEESMSQAGGAGAVAAGAGAGEDVEMEDVGAGGEGGEEDDGGDDRKYCTCRSVSYGNMVACDNPECPYEWFHWSCVGMTKEPVGTWFCEECRSKMG